MNTFNHNLQIPFITNFPSHSTIFPVFRDDPNGMTNREPTDDWTFTIKGTSPVVAAELHIETPPVQRQHKSESLNSLVVPLLKEVRYTLG